jgi:putative transposase
MPRGPRIEYPGAVYHVLCRGDQREPIFRNDADHELFLKTLAEGCEKTGWRVHAYVLMPNHYHWLIETPEGNLVAGMRWFQSTYTQRYNGRHKLCGHLFQGRYKALPIDGSDPDYFRTVSDYIHLNPARARLLNCESPDLIAFRGSSFPLYAGQAKRPAWLQTARVLGSHGLEDTSSGRSAYVNYMRMRVREEWSQEPGALAPEWREIRRGWYWGGEDFKERLLERLVAVVSGRKRESYSGAAALAHDERMAEQLLQRGLVALGLSLNAVKTLRQNDPRKQGLAWLLRTATVVAADWVSARLGMGHRSNVSRAVRKIDNARRGTAIKVRHILQPCKD